MVSVGARVERFERKRSAEAGRWWVDLPITTTAALFARRPGTHRQSALVAHVLQAVFGTGSYMQ